MSERPVYSLIHGTSTYIVHSSDVVVKDLLEKRSNIYSSRPDMYLAQDVASGGRRIVLMVSVSCRTRMGDLADQVLSEIWTALENSA